MASSTCMIPTLEPAGREERDLPSFSFNSILEICLLTLKESNTHALDWISLPESREPLAGFLHLRALVLEGAITAPMSKWKEISIPAQRAPLSPFCHKRRPRREEWYCIAHCDVRSADREARISHEIATSSSVIRVFLIR